MVQSNFLRSRLAASVAVVVSMLSISITTTAFAAEPEYEWRVSVVTPEGHPYNVGLQHFKERVEEDSDGRIAVEIFPSSQLGGEVESVKNVQLGTLEMAVISTSNASPFNKDLEVMGVPYLFKSLECGYKVLDGPIGQEMAEGLREQSGLRVLGWYTFGMRQIINTQRRILEPSDLEGLVFRVPADKMAEASYKAMGANPVPMAFPEMFNALQQGVIDGADNPLITVKSFKWYEVVEYVSITNTAAGLSPFLMSEKALQELPSGLQDLVINAGRESAKVNRRAEEKQTANAAEFLENHGVRIDEPDTEPFREAVEPVFDMAREQYGKQIVNRILRLQSDC